MLRERLHGRPCVAKVLSGAKVVTARSASDLSFCTGSVTRVHACMVSKKVLLSKLELAVHV